MTISFTPRTLQALMPIERDRLRDLTLPPRHPGEMSVFADLLRRETFEDHRWHSTLVLVAADHLRWVGWSLVWWRFNERVARIGAFVHPDYRGQGIGEALVRRMQLASGALELGLRAHATSPEGKRLFEKVGIENV